MLAERSPHRPLEIFLCRPHLRGPSPLYGRVAPARGRAARRAALDGDSVASAAPAPRRADDLVRAGDARWDDGRGARARDESSRASRPAARRRRTRCSARGRCCPGFSRLLAAGAERVELIELGPSAGLQPRAATATGTATRTADWGAARRCSPATTRPAPAGLLERRRDRPAARHRPRPDRRHDRGGAGCSRPSSGPTRRSASSGSAGARGAPRAARARARRLRRDCCPALLARPARRALGRDATGLDGYLARALASCSAALASRETRAAGVALARGAARRDGVHTATRSR